MVIGVRRNFIRGLPRFNPLQVIDTLPVGLHLVSFHRKSMGFVSSFDKRKILLFSSKSILD